MIQETRVKLLKSAKVPIQSRLSRLSTPSYPLMHSDEMQTLWDKFITSGYVKELNLEDANSVNYNYKLFITWLNFLEFNGISTPFDVLDAAASDMTLCVRERIHKVISNLRLYKVIPNFKLDDLSYRIELPTPTTSSRNLNSILEPTIRVLLSYVPTKRKTIDLRDTTKFKNSSVNFLLESKCQGYLYRGKIGALAPRKPIDVSQLMSLGSQHWFYKKESDCLFLNSGNRLCIRIDYSYPGVLPLDKSPFLLQNFDRVMSKALRAFI